MTRRRSADRSSRFGRRDTGDWIESKGRVIRLLPDDRDEARHQRMIVDIGGGETLLVVHSLEVADRVPVGLGDRIEFRGIYEWNDLGGLVHWTHRDPMGEDDGGFVLHRKRRYQ